MVPDRWSAFIGVTLAVLLAVPAAPPILGADPPSGIQGFSTAGSLPQAREGHTSTTLPDGRVLVVGGYSDGDFLNSAEVWDPTSGAFSPAGSLREARTRHTATLLAGGWVLVVGGSQEGRALTSAEAWDPASSNFAPLSSLRQGRSWHTATLLADGRVLVVGGVVVGDVGEPFTLLGSAEVWDPASSTFEPTGSLRQPRSGHTASLLPDGRVLVIGGSRRNGAPIDSAELWDPTSGTFEPTGSMHQARYAHTATRLSDGRVLVIGGYDSDFDPIATAEAWDPASGTFESAGSLNRGRADHFATGLPDGGVLLSGGINGDDETIAMAELWDPTTGTFSPAGALVEPRYRHTATLLSDGRVLLVAGRDMAGGLASSELWQSRQDQPMSTPGPAPSATPQVTLSPTPEPSRQVIERDLADSMGWAAWEPYRKSPTGTAFDPFGAGAQAGVIFDDLGAELHPSVDYIALFRFPDARRLDRYWQARATSAASEAPLRSAPCQDGRAGRDDWDHGEYLCYVSDSGAALLRWTDERTDTYGIMNAVAGSGNLKSLYRHWQSALRGPAASQEPRADETPRTIVFTAAEKVLLKGIPSRIAGTCVPRRNLNPAGTVAAVRCQPDSEVIREVTYQLMELDAAGRAFSQLRRKVFGDGSQGLGFRCDLGKPSWEPSIPYGSDACYRDDGGRANLRIVTGVTMGCTQLDVAGRRLKEPAIHIAVRGEVGDIARLFKAAYGGGRLWHMFEQAGAPPSDMCPH